MCIHAQIISIRQHNINIKNWQNNAIYPMGVTSMICGYACLFMGTTSLLEELVWSQVIH